MKQGELVKINEIVGSISEEQMRYVDYYIGHDIGVFMPVAGPCFFAITPEHIHPAYMFVLMFDDETNFVINGQIMPTQSGNFFALAPGIPHHEIFAGNAPRYIAIMIKSSFFESHLAKYNLGFNLAVLNGFYKPSSNLLILLQRFMVESGKGLPGFEDIIAALSIEICHDLIRSIVNIPIETDVISSRLEIGKAIAYIHSHLHEKITVIQIARAVNMSTSHFARLFKHETGKTPLTYLQMVRLERVKKLLTSSNKSITEIALENGFNSSAYLATAFLKKYHLTPSDYQKKFKK